MMLSILLLATLAAAAPPSSKKLIVTENFFPESQRIYSGDHDIVEILVPLNQLNYPEDPSEATGNHLRVIFFVEADIKENGENDYKGIYVYKDGQAKKLLDNGQSVTYGKEYDVFFGAKDGIYKYNKDTVSAEKYGSVTENVIKMAVDVDGQRIYYLTEDHVLFKFDENQETSTKVDAVKDARDIVFDFEGNLIYYNGKNEVFIYKRDGNVIKVLRLPANPTSVQLVKSPVIIDHLYVIIDKVLYKVNLDGTSKVTFVKFEALPTATAPDNVVLQFYAYNKSLYEYNIYEIGNYKIEGLREFLEDQKDEIQLVARSRKTNHL